MPSPNSPQRFVSIGECMIEMSGGEQNQYRLGFAGDTLNTAWYARICLPDSWQVDYVTALGDDVYSDQIRAFVNDRNIGTDHIRTIEGKRPGLYMIHQAEGDRHFTYWRETSAAKKLADDVATLEKAVGGANLIYFSGITLAILSEAARERLLKVIGAAREAGARVAFDPNIRPVLWPSQEATRQAFAEACKVVDIAIPTFDDDQVLFGDEDKMACVKRYLSYGVEEVVVKNGAESALIVSGDQQIEVAAIETTNVVDASGAGDSFSGAYLAARLSGQQPSQCAQSAHQIASKVIQHPGALVPREALA